MKVDGLDIFYREAGSKSAPTILLLHGFPSSSHMFRDLIPLLADRYHVIAPDYPGFGYSSQPAREQFQYTFDNLYAVVDKFTHAVGAEKFAIYIQDYGSPIGLRFALHHPLSTAEESKDYGSRTLAIFAQCQWTRPTGVIASSKEPECCDGQPKMFSGART